MRFETKPLGELCEYRPAKSEARKRLHESDLVTFLPMEDLGIDQKHVVGRQKRSLGEVGGSYTYFADGDVLLAKITPCFQNGKLGIARGLENGIGFGSSEYIVLRPGKDLDAAYLYYFLSREDFRQAGVSRMGGSVGQQRVPPEFVLGERIPLPPLPEQRRIVRILDEAFARIATAKANAEKNLRNARELFDSHVHSTFVARGDGWTESTLDRLAANLDSKRVPITKGDRKSGEYPYYGASGIVDYVADWIFDDDILLVSEDGANLLARSTPIAFSVSGKCWVNNHAHILKFGQMATQRFVEFYLESIPLDKYVTGAAQPKLNQRALNSIPIPIPQKLEEQARIIDDIETLSAECRRLESLYRQKLAALDALKKSLLHQAFTGQLVGNDSTAEPAAIVIAFPKTIERISTTDLHAGILAIACQRHEVAGKLDDFTHVKAEKIAHMVEARLGIDLGRKPIKDAAGPNDFNHLKKVEHRAKMTNAFDFKRVEGGAYRVEKLRGFNRLVEKTRAALGDQLAEVDDLLEWMLPMSVRQAEIVATVYAAWNNLLLDGKTPTDEEIVFESRENWHPEKLKIERWRFVEAVGWLRKEGVVPEGKGKRVEKRSA